MPEIERIKINTRRLGKVEEIRRFLTDLEDTYNNLLAFDLLILDIENSKRRKFPFHWKERFYYRETPYSEILNFGDSILPQDQLIISRINVNSPGFWEFIGSLNPLQQIREYLKDRHERRKDRDWREKAQKDQMNLNNELLRTQLIEKRVEILRSAGFSENEIRSLLNKHLVRPLLELDKHQDSGLIDDAE